MFTIKRGKYKSKLIYDKTNNANTYIASLVENAMTITNWEKNKFTGMNEQIKTKMFEGDEFYSGLSVYVKKMIISMGADCTIVDLRSYYKPDAGKAVRRIMKRLRYKLRDYQSLAIVKSIGKPHTLISLPTGTGKSLVMAAMLVGDNMPTIIIVDSKNLMYQLVRSIEDSTGKKCGYLGDGKFYPQTWTVAVIDSLFSENGNTLIKSAGAIYWDEAHHTGAPTYKRVVDMAKDNVIIRRGFSGTTFRNDRKNILLPALSGPVTVHITTSEAIDAGWLSVPHIYLKRIDNFKCKIFNYNAMYRQCIINNKYRNAIGVGVLADAFERGQPSFGLFRNVETHWPNIRDQIYKRVPKEFIAVLHGRLDMKTRERSLEEFADGTKKILLASVGTTGEGIDLPGNTKIGVNFSGGASEIAVRQMLGRLLRKPKIGTDVDRHTPFHVSWYDFYDTTHGEMERQSNIRRDIYMNEPAFIMEEDGGKKI